MTSIDFDEILRLVPADRPRSGANAALIAIERDVPVKASRISGHLPEPQFRQLDITDGAADRIWNVVHRTLVELRSRAETVWRTSGTVYDYDWGVRPDADGRIGLFGTFGDSTLRRIAEAAVQEVSVPPTVDEAVPASPDGSAGELLAALAARIVCGFALTVGFGDRWVVVVRKRQGMTAAGADSRRLVLHVNRRRMLEAVGDTITFDGGCDAVLWGGSAAVLDPAGFEAIFGQPAKTDRKLSDLSSLLEPLLSQPELAAALVSDARFRERLRTVDPDEIPDFRTAAVWEAIGRYDLDGVSADEAGLHFQNSSAGRSQAVRLIEDGFLRSESTGHRYSAEAKERWAPRRLVTGVEVCEDEEGRKTPVRLFGDGWSEPAATVVEHLAKRLFRYSASSGPWTSPIERRRRGDGIVLWSREPDPLLDERTEGNFLLKLPRRVAAPGPERTGQQDRTTG